MEGNAAEARGETGTAVIELQSALGECVSLCRGGGPCIRWVSATAGVIRGAGQGSWVYLARHPVSRESGQREATPTGCEGKSPRIVSS